MKILHVTMHYLPVKGGQEVYIDSLNNLLNKEGVSTDIVQPFSRHVAERPLNVSMLPRLPYLHRLIHDVNWFWFNVMLLFFQKKIKRYDVVISHYAFHGDFLKSAKKLVVLSHGVEWNRPPKTLADKYRSAIAHKTALGKAVIVANDTDYFRTVGIPANPAEKYFEEVAPGRWFIPNCVDGDKYQPGPDSKREKMLLVPRNIRWGRGIHLAVEAFYYFSKTHIGFRMVIVGGPLSGSYYRYCCDLVKKLCLEDCVVFEGSVVPDKMIQYYQKASVTLIPTLALEGTSLSALESMSTKTPVVSTNVGGLLDLPTLQSEPFADKIAEKLSYLLENYEKIRLEQYSHTREVFNMANWQKAWLRVLRA